MIYTLFDDMNFNNVKSAFDKFLSHHKMQRTKLVEKAKAGDPVAQEVLLKRFKCRILKRNELLEFESQISKHD